MSATYREFVMALDPEHQSQAERLAFMNEDERRKMLDEILDGAGPEAISNLNHSWDFWARPHQLEPREGCPCGCDGKWLNWVIIAGRGWGKTRTGAEWIHMKANNGTYELMHLVGATAADARDIMVLGESGILGTQKPQNKVTWSPTNRRLTWENGAQALVFSADEPDRLRGLQCEAAWADEIAAWRYEESWKQLQLGLRLGSFPRTIITTTPRPKKLIKDLLKDPKNHVTRGSTYDNVSNLAQAFINEITRDLEQSRFGRQEIYAEILDEAELANWSRETLEACRIEREDYDKMVRDGEITIKKIVIGVDVAVSHGEESAETGIIVAGLDRHGRAYVLSDHTGRYRPDQWAKKVSALYHRYNEEAPEVRVIAEKNMGYELIRHTIQVEDPAVPVKLVHASKSKLTRAEPVATAYEVDKVRHVGMFPILEEQMCTWEAGNPDSPDRLDALVWALTELIVVKRAIPAVAMIDNELGDGSNYWKAVDTGPTSPSRSATISPNW